MTKKSRVSSVARKPNILSVASIESDMTSISIFLELSKYGLQKDVLMDTQQIAKALKELGYPTRLTIFRQVLRAGYADIPVGQLQQALDIPGSTLSHHISGLVSAGLLMQRREGRTLFCIGQFEQLERVISFCRMNVAWMRSSGRRKRSKHNSLSAREAEGNQIPYFSR